VIIVDIIIGLIIALIAIVTYLWNRMVLNEDNSYEKSKRTIKELKDLVEDSIKF
jgi:uncharacterized protein YxeA